MNIALVKLQRIVEEPDHYTRSIMFDSWKEHYMEIIGHSFNISFEELQSQNSEITKDRIEHYKKECLSRAGLFLGNLVDWQIDRHSFYTKWWFQIPIVTEK